MHSGHGDETPDDQYRQNPGTPEPRRGVVLPPEQPPQHYEDHVRPAGGQPWDQVPGAAQPLPPEAGAGADATMMFPPYPQATPPAPAMPPAMPQAPPAAAAPVPEADATQFLPPYPRSSPPPEPFTPDPFQAEPFAPEPFAPEPFTPEHFGAGTGPAGYPAESEAEATRHLSLSIFDEPSYDQPQGPSYDQSYDEPQSAPSDDYDHLYRQDGPRQQPRPEPARQQPYRVQAAPPAPAPAQGHADPYDGANGTNNANGANGGGGGGSRRRLSPAAVIGIVVGGCALAGLAAGAALSAGGDDDSKDQAKASKPPASSAGASAQPGGAADDAATKQAKTLDALLKDSGSSRSSVVSAVESIKSCKNLPQAAADLRAAAGQRGTLVTRLAALQVDQLPQHAELSEALNKAWAASAAADNAYASWADQAAGDGKTCKGGHAKGTPVKSVGDRESGSATAQKKRAVRLWNAIAKQHNLTEREYSQL